MAESKRKRISLSEETLRNEIVRTLRLMLDVVQEDPNCEEINQNFYRMFEQLRLFYLDLREKNDDDIAELVDE